MSTARPHRFPPIKRGPGAKVGTGAYSSVWRTDDPDVVCKELDEDTPGQMSEEFVREVSALRLLAGTGMTVELVDYDPQNERIYLERYADGDAALPLDVALLRKKIVDKEVWLLYAMPRRLLECIACAQDHCLMHRDVKLRNLLTDRDGPAVLCDWGLCRFAPDPATPAAPETTHTGEMQTLWYRAPEVVAEPNGHYSYPIDVWSVGAIWLRDVLLEHPRHTAYAKERGWRCKLTYFNESGQRNFFEAVTVAWPELQEEMARSIGPLGVDLLGRLLDADPTRRITAADALAHPYYADDIASAPPPPTDPQTVRLDRLVALEGRRRERVADIDRRLLKQADPALDAAQRSRLAAMMLELSLGTKLALTTFLSAVLFLDLTLVRKHLPAGQLQHTAAVCVMLASLARERRDGPCLLFPYEVDLSRIGADDPAQLAHLQMAIFEQVLDGNAFRVTAADYLSVVGAERNTNTKAMKTAQRLLALSVCTTHFHAWHPSRLATSVLLAGTALAGTAGWARAGGRLTRGQSSWRDVSTDRQTQQDCRALLRLLDPEWQRGEDGWLPRIRESVERASRLLGFSAEHFQRAHQLATAP